MYTITISKEESMWTDAKCTCPYYAKAFMCKHIIALAIRMEILQEEMPDPDSRVLKPNKKNGRPKNTPKGKPLQKM